MNTLHLPPFLYACIAAATLWLALLWVCARLKMKRRNRVLKTTFGVATILLLFVPLDGVPLWNRAFSFYTNPSLPMLGLVCAALWQRLFGIVVFKPADWRATWIFGAVAGSALYLHPMILGALDLYYWGWERTYAIWTLAGLAVIFLAAGNRLGVLLLAALIGYAVNALESQNCWDYVMDPFFWFVSLGAIVVRAAARIAQGMRRRASSDIVPARIVVLPGMETPAEEPEKSVAL